MFRSVQLVTLFSHKLKMIFNVFIIISICVLLSLASKKQCYRSPPREYLEKYFSTKTPYRIIKNSIDREIKYPDCEPIRIWALIRHGSRNPGKSVIIRAQDRLMKIREKILSSQANQLCSHELAILRNWSFNVDINQRKFLVYEGEDELIELGERMQNRFPKILPDHYDPEYFKFKYTATQRTLKSAESFTFGLFGRHNKEVQYLDPLHKDPILRFYKLCKKWQADINKQPDTLYESMEFLNSDIMHKVIKNIEKKAGVKGLTVGDIQLMYTICAYETAWNKQRVSIWCTFFDLNDIQVLEFERDLKYYWNDGYGYELTYQQACAAFVDMIFHISPDSHYSNATIYFTHSGTILKMLAHLGLYKDDFVLTHNDFYKERKFRTSEIDAFGSNLAFITYSCKNDYKVLVMHQERIVHLPGCPQDEDLCSFKTIQKLYRTSIEHCNFDELCEINTGHFL